MQKVAAELAGKPAPPHTKTALGDEVIDFGTTPSEDMGDTHVPGEALGTKGYIYKGKTPQQLNRKLPTVEHSPRPLPSTLRASSHIILSYYIC